MPVSASWRAARRPLAVGRPAGARIPIWGCSGRAAGNAGQCSERHSGRLGQQPSSTESTPLLTASTQGRPLLWPHWHMCAQASQLAMRSMRAPSPVGASSQLPRTFRPRRRYLCDTPFPFSWSQLLMAMLLANQFMLPFVIVSSSALPAAQGRPAALPKPCLLTNRPYTLQARSPALRSDTLQAAAAVCASFAAPHWCSCAIHATSCHTPCCVCSPGLGAGHRFCRRGHPGTPHLCIRSCCSPAPPPLACLNHPATSVMECSGCVDCRLDLQSGALFERC